MQIETIIDQARAYWKSRIILTAVELDLFTALNGDRRDLDSLASDLRLSRRGLHLLLDVLVSIGLLLKEDGRYSNTETSARFLDRNSPEDRRGGRLRHQVRLWQSWDRLTEVVRTGRPSRREDPTGDDWSSFLQAMHHGKAVEAGEIVRRLDLRNVSRAIDLGGGYQLAILSSISHSYGPEENRKLMEKVFTALEPGGRIAVRDFWLDDSMTEPEEAAVFSINMLVNTDKGRSYSENEFKQILGRVGFCDPRRLPSDLIYRLYRGRFFTFPLAILR